MNTFFLQDVSFQACFFLYHCFSKASPRSERHTISK